MHDLQVMNLRKEVKRLKDELSSCKENIKHLQEREILLQDRLSNQAQKQFSRGPTKFEDLSIGAQRPSELIRRYCITSTLPYSLNVTDMRRVVTVLEIFTPNQDSMHSIH